MQMLWCFRYPPVVALVVCLFRFRSEICNVQSRISYLPLSPLLSDLISTEMINFFTRMEFLTTGHLTIEMT